MEPPEKGTRILMTDLCRVKQGRELSNDGVVMSDFSKIRTPTLAEAWMANMTK